jgi:hypothetical protein
MKFLTIFAITALLSPHAAQATDSDKFKIASHDHKHGAECGHEAVEHGDHTDYIHDGHLHAEHAGHFDNHGPERMDKTTRKTASAEHLIASDHKHKHGKKCGHEVVKHGDHVEYLHDGQYHAKHGTHYDQHGTPTAN